MTDYEGYVAFCQRVGNEPMDEEQWLARRFSSACCLPHPDGVKFRVLNPVEKAAFEEKRKTP